MRIPANVITTGKYTIGDEYVLLPSQNPYQGYYYELNNRTFAGRKFNPNAPEIIKITSDKFNPFLDNPSTATYAKLTKLKPNNFIPTTVIYRKDFSTGFVDRYFIEKANITPYLIKEVTKESYEKALLDPSYIAIKISWNKEGYSENIDRINTAEKTMPGIKEYLKKDIDIGDAPV
jgi:hypothetical protein